MSNTFTLDYFLPFGSKQRSDENGRNVRGPGTKHGPRTCIIKGNELGKERKREKKKAKKRGKRVSCIDA